MAGVSETTVPWTAADVVMRHGEPIREIRCVLSLHNDIPIVYPNQPPSDAEMAFLERWLAAVQRGRERIEFPPSGKRFQ